MKVSIPPNTQHKDINITSVNRIYPRTSFMSYESVEDAKTFDFEKSRHFQLLNGTWKFFFSESGDELSNDLLAKDVDLSEWKDIKVPGNWEFQGFGTPIYTNIAYDFAPVDPKPPFISDKRNSIGIYRRNFNVEKEEIERNLFLHIAAAKSGVYVYVNGQFVGYSEDSKDPAEYLINKYVEEGENTLVLKIYRYSTGSYLEDQDFWRVSGIERDVFLWSQPLTHVEDFAIVSTLDDEYKNGVFRLNVKLSSNEQCTVNLSYKLGNVATEENEIVLENGQTDVTFEATIKDVRQWSAEKPNLYDLFITLSKGQDVIEVIPFRVGFRRSEVKYIKDNKGDVKCYFFNGKTIRIKGVNLHEHNMLTGHYVTDDIRMKDIELLKKNNFNALRLSHYPQDRRLYDLCDIYGLYVVSEANIESHGMGYKPEKTLGNDKKWLPKHMERTLNMYERTKNYACVAFFSLGNEAGNGCNFQETYYSLSLRENKGNGRPVNYEQAGMEWNTDCYVPMYPSIDSLKYAGDKIRSLPTIPCEYSHAMGNSNGNIAAMWRLFNSATQVQGGFIWDWVDQGILEKDKDGREYFTYGGDYGKNAPSDGNFNINGLVNPDRTPHPAMKEVKYAQQNVLFSRIPGSLDFIMKNGFYFTDLSDYVVTWQLQKNDKIIESKTFEPELGPQETKVISLNDQASNIVRDYAEYYVNFIVKTKRQIVLVPADYEVAHQQFALGSVGFVPKIPFSLEDPSPVKITKTMDTVVASSDNVSFVFNTKSCVVTSFVVDGKEQFANGFGIRPNFWRAPTDNDYGSSLAYDQSKWRELSHSFELGGVSVKEEHGIGEIEVKYKLPTMKSYTIKYKVYPNGFLHCDVKYSTSFFKLDLPSIPRIGLRFRIDAGKSHIEYFGKGPEENYCDRCDGAMIARYETTADDEYFPYVRPQENGHHTSAKYLMLSDNKGSGVAIIYGNDAFEFNALKNSVEDFDDEEQVELPRQWHNFSHPFFDGNKSPDHDEKNAKCKLRRQHHINDIVPRDFIEVCIDKKQQGLAGFNSWGDRPLKEFMIEPDVDYSFDFTMIPFNKKTDVTNDLKFKYSF